MADVAQKNLDPAALISTPAAAELLGVRAQTLEVWRCAKRYDLPYLKIGNGVRYRVSDLLAFLDRATVIPKPLR